jgi:hypothetical protein
MNYNFGHIPPWWGEEFKNLPYKNPPVNQLDIDMWTNQGYENLKLHGSVYGQAEGPAPEFSKKFYNLFDWTNTGITFFKMTCGQALPTHQDRYLNYQRIYKIVDPSVIWRCIVFLEDWKSGHYFEINGKPIVDWKAGDWVNWNFDVPHFAGNIGIEPRYTVQITGMK